MKIIDINTCDKIKRKNCNLYFFNFRIEIEQLRSGNFHKIHHNQHTTQEKNDHLTVKWLSTSLSEIKIEMSELQNSLNSSTILQNHEVIDGELNLLKTDVINLNKELETSRNKNAKYEADLTAVKEELNFLKDSHRATAVICGKTKNQVSYTFYFILFLLYLTIN